MSGEFFPHMVYRVYDEDGGLLYVGMSRDIYNRFAVHDIQTLWWEQAHHATTEEFPDRYQAEAAERAAIEAEYPFHNKLHKLGGCPTCKSPSPTWHPRPQVGAVDVVLCADKFHVLHLDHASQCASHRELVMIPPLYATDLLPEAS